MHRSLFRSSILLACALALSACSHDTPPALASPTYAAAPTGVAPAAAPVIVNAAPAQSGATDMLLGGAAGFALAKLTSGPTGGGAAPPASTTVINKTVIHKTVVHEAPKPTLAAVPPPAPKPAAIAPAPVSLAKAPSYAPRSSYVTSSSSSTYRAAASPMRSVSYSSPSYSSGRR